MGFSHVRIVEHYFHYYGGYSPNPIVFLAAAAQRTRRARLVTGAKTLPAFNHPLKLAGEIAMLDAISGGRLDVGFWCGLFCRTNSAASAAFPTESQARFREGIEQVDLLLREENGLASRPLSFDREHDLVAGVADPAAASQILCRRAQYAGIV